jgi:hypothetical protein
MESEARLRERRPNPVRLNHPIHPEVADTTEERRARNIGNLLAKLDTPRISDSFTQRQRERRQRALDQLIRAHFEQPRSDVNRDVLYVLTGRS